MERINRLIIDEEFVRYCRKIEELETSREFCRHDLVHFLDVCRISWILNLERHLHLDKEMVYAAGLLHDIGRWIQIETGQDHALASADLCEKILLRNKFMKDEIILIKEAILNHRKKTEGSPLTEILYDADKYSRRCFACSVISECKNFQSNKKPRLEY